MESFDLYFGLKLGKLLYSHTDNLSKTLQDEKMSAMGGKRLATLTFNVIEGMRNEESFDRIYDGCVDQIKEFPFVEKPVLKRKRKAPNYSILQHVEGYNSSETSSHHSESPRDHYRVLFYEVVDALVSSVQERFNQPSFLIFEQLESLSIKTLKGEETTKELSSVESNYQSDINVEELEVELQTLKVLLKDKDVVCADDLISVMQSLLSEEKKLIKNVCVLCH